ncbi:MULTISPECIES: NADP-dependent oxidoreductase [Kitasatospora]|uniref:NADP-dependent oxidoreductase n=1 Tax=Kitasatospora TaxID=2063 RepID=UPI0004C46493|nr:MULTISPECIES: NADP-dependent oxidoreductase [unclassified Kitasatospora]WAL70375.1 NADP-dependent oxidoreductase [Kitasatospora sp. YST-16]WNW36416.1 NADP-dependent oxidoreductase [Streptomyces sp. Li-HN-5-13]
MPATNRQIRLARRPVGPVRQEDWTLTEEPVTGPADGWFLGRTRYLSLDPAMRGWLDDRPSYLPPVGLGEVMRAGSILEVVESAHPDFRVGEFVSGSFGVQEYALSDGRGTRRIDPAAAPLPTHLGALGTPGMTAYFGLLEVGALNEGETVAVSGAAGAVGSLVGQIAKLKGCRVIGIAGGPAKCAWLTEELGFDAAVDYQTEDVRKALRTHAPDGIDVYFDNVGGTVLDAALTRLAVHARVVICGAISQYNNEHTVQGPANYLSLLVRRARMQGFVVFDYVTRYPEAAREIAGWIADGRLSTREHLVKGGVDAFPETFQMLFRGANTGKLILDLT